MPIATGCTELEVQLERDIFVAQRDVRSTRSRSRSVPLATPQLVNDNEEIAVVTDLPKRLPLTRDELAIWRAFLSNEIDAIMRDEG